MKIRGNTVSTTMAPEKIAEKIGGTGSGLAPIIVTYDETTGKASHTASQITELLTAGKQVLFYSGDYYFTPSAVYGDIAYFSVQLDDYTSELYQILDTGAVLYDCIAVAKQEDIGNISAALDELHAYAQALAKGGATG